MEGIIQAGGVAAAAVVLAFGLYRGLLQAKVIPKLNQNQGFLIVLAVIAASFVTTLVIVRTPEPTIFEGGGSNSGAQLSEVDAKEESNITIENRTSPVSGQSPSNTGTQLKSVEATGGSSISIDNTAGGMAPEASIADQ